MADQDAIERRLVRAGLDEGQVDEALEANLHDLDGFQRWLESVHDDDIKEKFSGEAAEEGSGQPADDGSSEAGSGQPDAGSLDGADAD